MRVLRATVGLATGPCRGESRDEPSYGWIRGGWILGAVAAAALLPVACSGEVAGAEREALAPWDWEYTVVETSLPRTTESDGGWSYPRGDAATDPMTEQLNGMAEHGWEYLGIVNDASLGEQVSYSVDFVAMRRPKDSAGSYYDRGLELDEEKRYEEALEAWRAALRLREDYAAAHNSIAWQLCTCPDEDVRKGRKAIDHAERACELTDWKEANFIDTLAAAHAERGSFERAVEFQRQALELAPASSREDFESRLDLYRTEQPYRQPGSGDAPDE